MEEAAQDKLLLCFYGDDFTGSTDAMESLASQGMRAILFLDVPTMALLRERFPDLRAFGVAGVARSLTPAQMEGELRPILHQLRQFGPPIVHYKVCSTFDSSPTVGSIGRVLEMGRELFPAQVVPILAGAPTLKRYTVFGNHFATVGTETVRIDRHPTMAHHPVTPMREGDLRRHLAEQTSEPVALMDILSLTGSAEAVRRRYRWELRQSPSGLLFDVLDDERLETAGMLLWEQAQKAQLFVIGSSGVGSALTAHWGRLGLIENNSRLTSSIDPAHPVLAVSGSCSPVTAEQIKWALANGYVGLRVSTGSLIDPSTREETMAQIYQEAKAHLDAGSHVIIYSALGPEDPSIDQTKTALARLGLPTGATGQLLGQHLGQLVKGLLQTSDVNRVILCGGDTSSHATRELGIYALEARVAIAPGAPLCRAYAESERFDGLEVALKGGQIGSYDYFYRVQQGGIRGEVLS